MKTILKIIGFLILLALAAVAGFFLIETGSEERDPFSFVPEDFVYAIESDRPVGDWQDLSSTEVWQYLKGTEFLADITESADYLDSLLQANQTLVDFIKLGDMIISAHMISKQDYDFLIMVDLKGKGRKLPKLKPVMVPLFESLGYEVKTDNYYRIELYNLYDKVYDETLTMAAIDNVLLISYTEGLVKKAIDQSEKPSIKENPNFTKVREKTDRDELYTLYLNYGQLDKLILAYTTEMPEMLEGIEEILTFSSFDLDMGDDKVEMTGYMKQKDSVASFLSVFKEVGTGTIHADKVLPQNTAMFTSIGFDDFADFYKKFDAYYAESSPEDYKTIEKSRKLIENRLKIEFERDFFSWMTDEIVTAVIPTEEDGSKYSYYAMLHFGDYEKAKERLDYVTKRIGKTPVKFEELNYQGYTIKYLELRGFFKIFFKKLFSKIEKPHFTYIDDYVVFSNDTTALQAVIDQYLQDNVLARSDTYDDFKGKFDSKSSIFTYINNKQFYDYTLSSLDYEARRDMQKNKEYFLSFPHIGFQVSPSGEMYESVLYGEFKKLEDDVTLRKDVQ
ncbi:MAG: DUF3352 domain-containing protein [Bacteroidetes bacterium]|nr:DUF3352 domain-containing protein [Bacteroidota bacterium]